MPVPGIQGELNFSRLTDDIIIHPHNDGGMDLRIGYGIWLILSKGQVEALTEKLVEFKGGDKNEKS